MRGGGVEGRDVGEKYPEVVFAGEVYLGAGGDGGTDVGPWSVDSLRAVNSDLASGGETVVPAVRIATDERRIVSIVTDPRASHGVRIRIYRSSESQQGRDDRALHRLEIQAARDRKTEGQDADPRRAGKSTLPIYTMREGDPFQGHQGHTGGSPAVAAESRNLIVDGGNWALSAAVSQWWKTNTFQDELYTARTSRPRRRISSRTLRRIWADTVGLIRVDRGVHGA